MHYTILNFTEDLLLNGFKAVCDLNDVAVVDGNDDEALAALQKQSAKADSQTLVLFHSLNAELAKHIALEPETELAITRWTKTADKVCAFHKTDRRKVSIVYADELLISVRAVSNDSEGTSLQEVLGRFAKLEILPASKSQSFTSELNSHLDKILDITGCESFSHYHRVNVSRVNVYESLERDSLVKALARIKNDKLQDDSEKSQLLNQYARDLETLKAERTNGQEENELLMLQLQQVQEELESIYIENQSLKQALLDEKNDHEKKQLLLKTQLEQAVSSAISQESYVELKEENELLLLQLQQVQEELEHYYLKSKNLNDSVEDSVAFEAESRIEGKSGEKNSKSRLRVLKQYILFLMHGSVIKKSALFDSDWYLREYADVKRIGMDPARHYFIFGADEGRDPGPKFSTMSYLMMNPDVKASGINPLYHFEKFGRAENRSY